jgi:hypothetical protein
MRQILVIIISFLSFSLITSCAMVEIWTEKKTYDDKISGFLASKKGDKIAFIGNKYHYIFNDKSKAIKRLLRWSGNNILEANIYKFSIKKEVVELELAIKSKHINELTLHEEKFLEDLSFTKTDKNIFQKHITLYGKRYLPSPDVDYDIYSLKKTYNASIEIDSVSLLAKKIAITPIAVAVDSMNIVGFGYIAYYTLPFMITFWGIDMLNGDSGLTYHSKPYNRKDYKHWIDADKDCQDTRQEVLIQESLIKPKFDKKRCRVISGKWYDPYTDQYFTNPSDLDVDHFIPLKEAHISGAESWSKTTKERFANNLHNESILIAVSKFANRSKSAKDPSKWIPKNKKYHCEYINIWKNIKDDYNLIMDAEEKSFVKKKLSECN